MRIAIISDTHLPRGTRRLPAKCLEELSQAEAILHAGDFTAASVLDELEAIAAVHGVYGNMDDAALYEKLPRERVVEVHGIRIGMVHVPGPRSGRAERLVEAFPGCQAIVYGHTHEPEIERLGETILVNPGSPTERRRSPTRAMARLTLEPKRLQAELVPLP